MTDWIKLYETLTPLKKLCRSCIRIQQRKQMNAPFCLSLEYDVWSTANQRSSASNAGSIWHGDLESACKQTKLIVFFGVNLVPFRFVHFLQRNILVSTANATTTIMSPNWLHQRTSKRCNLSFQSLLSRLSVKWPASLSDTLFTVLKQKTISVVHFHRIKSFACYV